MFEMGSRFYLSRTYKAAATFRTQAFSSLSGKVYPPIVSSDLALQTIWRRVVATYSTQPQGGWQQQRPRQGPQYQEAALDSTLHEGSHQRFSHSHYDARAAETNFTGNEGAAQHLNFGAFHQEVLWKCVLRTIVPKRGAQINIA
jgi:hypothetical protein